MMEFGVSNTGYNMRERQREKLAATSISLSHARQRQKTGRLLVYREGVRL